MRKKAKYNERGHGDLIVTGERRRDSDGGESVSSLKV